ncbi:hypothetical protein LVD15_19605 [Fulvivirga maritima]|uniref:hypothetical protein n=1 Tax=Fulvivirga maritima TaxID=2904247 RepID=UPI001F40D5D6|nr:hypothetical protein [Fulvivirga maritima]UII25492.1 hypothetical protein LVD15_19605 [Fulvivirga maritima]
MKNIVMICFALIALGQTALGQPGRRGDFADRIDEEKKEVLQEITDLNDDQKLLIEEVYEQFKASLKNTMSTGERGEMREKFQDIKTEKDNAIKDVLNEDQFKLYEELMQKRKPPRRQQRDE